jgi:hypothetical protein
LKANERKKIIQSKTGLTINNDTRSTMFNSIAIIVDVLCFHFGGVNDVPFGISNEYRYVYITIRKSRKERRGKKKRGRADFAKNEKKTAIIGGS